LLNKVASVFLLLIAFSVLFPSQVLALGVGVAPHKLELEAYPLGSTTSQINVLNTSTEEGLYQVYAEGEGKDWFSITPEEFVLKPDSSQVVEVAISPPLTAHGDYNASICVVSLVPASELKVGCGIKVPVHIVIVPPPPIGRVAEIMQGASLLWIIIAVAATVVIGVVIWRRRRRAYEI